MGSLITHIFVSLGQTLQTHLEMVLESELFFFFFFFAEADSVADAFMGLDLLLSTLDVAWFSVPEERVWSFASLDLGILSLLLYLYP